MHVSLIRVRYHLTANLGDYNNVKPEVELEAKLAITDDPVSSAIELMLQARLLVEAQIDEALEKHDKPARYSEEPRFDVLRYHPTRTLIIVPHGTKEDAIGENVYSIATNFRGAHALRFAHENNDTGAFVLNCSDGNIEGAAELVARHEAERERQRAEALAERERKAAEYQAAREAERQAYNDKIFARAKAAPDDDDADENFDADEYDDLEYESDDDE